MIENRDTSQMLSYASPPPGVRLTALLAIVSVLLAVISFPLGVVTSIWMGVRPEIFPAKLAERGGFLVFDAGEGLACALGLLAWIRCRPAGRRGWVPWLARVGTILGAIGSLIAIGMIWIRKIH